MTSPGLTRPSPVTGADAGRLLATVDADPGAPVRVAVLAPAGHGKSTLLDVLRERWPEATGDPACARATGAPLLVDDAHLASEQRLAAIGEYAGRDDARVVVAARPWPRPEALRTLLDAMTRTVPALALAPLTPEETARFVAASTGRAPSATAARFLHSCTGGVPGFLDRVVSACGADTIEQSAAQRRLTRESVDRFRADLDGLDEPTARLLVAAEAGAGNDLGLLGELLDSDGAALSELIEGARATALLGRDGTPPPVAGLAIRSLSPADRRLDVLRRMTEYRLRGDQPVLGLARMLLGSGVTGRSAAAAFEKAAHEAIDADAALAANLFRAASAANGPTTALTGGLARAAVLSGDLDTALRLSDGLVAAEDPRVRAEGAAVAATVLAHRGELARSAELFQWAGPGSATAFAAVGLLGTGDPDAARALLAAPGRRGAPTLLAGAATRMAEAIADSVSGTPADVLAPLISAAGMVEPAGGATLMPDSPAALAAIAALHSGEISLAESVLARALENGSGGPLFATRHRILLAWVAMTRGDLAEAAARLAPVGGRALEPRDELFRRAVEVGLARRASDIPGMRRAWQHAYQAMMRHQADLFVLLPLGELTIAAARLGEHDRLDRHVAQATDLLSALGNPPLWTVLVSWSRLQAAVITQDHPAAGRHAEALAATPGRFGGALAEAATSWRAVLDGAPDAEQVCAAAGRLHALGLRWDAARLAGQAAIRTEDRQAMVMLLEAARGFQGLARQPRQAPSGEQPSPEVAPAPAVADVSALSEREQEVAGLVLHGLTYKQIGARLFISAKTVEHHVARMRTRLGATDRRELLEMLRELLA
ncbi:helix-turn-helix transcriptional regulator [Amycolatopsis antarctica]|uniref:helix-turn-helix transcriptional regulator n=1 Tax=Amycolatopsis antarctica TaxID=1854586 RepID=UPI001F0A7F71|nr:LuxR family transcriptional regulator [Amycolatopsis antarctica]